MSKNQSDDIANNDGTVLEQRRSILQDAIDSFSIQLEHISPQDRDAMLACLYKEMRDTLFSFQVTLALNIAPRKSSITNQKQNLLNEFRRLL